MSYLIESFVCFPLPKKKIILSVGGMPDSIRVHSEVRNRDEFVEELEGVTPSQSPRLCGERGFLFPMERFLWGATENNNEKMF